MQKTGWTQTGPFLTALGLAAIWLAAFAAGGAGSHWDLRLLSALHQDERNGLVELAWVITYLGDWIILVPASLAAAVILLWRGSQLQAIALIGTVAALRILVALQKNWFARDRPEVEQ